MSGNFEKKKEGRGGKMMLVQFGERGREKNG